MSVTTIKVLGQSGEIITKSCFLLFDSVRFYWSGREDSNLRPPAPKAGALARLRYAPNMRLILKDLQEIGDIFVLIAFCPYFLVL